MSRMKGILAVLSALLVAGQTWALEVDLSKITVDGSMEVKGQSANNETDLNDTVTDKRGSTRHRLTLGVGGELTEGVMTRVEAVRNPTNANVGQFGGAAQSVQTEQTNLVLRNAYVSLDDVIWGIGAKLGRMYWGSKNSLVGFTGHYDDDSLTSLGVDGLTLNKKAGHFDINYSQLTVTDTKTLITADSTVGGGRVTVKSLGASANIKDLSGNDMADIPVGLTIHHATNQGAAISGDDINLGIYELNVGANLMEGMVTLGLDWGSNFGQRNFAAVAGTSPQPAKVKYKGSVMALKGALNHEESGFGASIELAQASGDDNQEEPLGTAAQAQDTDDKSWHDLTAAGLAPYRHYGEILGKSNTLWANFAGSNLQGLDAGTPVAGGQSRGMNVMALGVHYTPPVMDKKWKFALDYITAESDKLNTLKAASSGLTGTGGDATTLKKDIGSEIDLSASYMKSENVSFKVGYAQFDPEKLSAALTSNVGDKVTKLFANANVRF